MSDNSSGKLVFKQVDFDPFAPVPVIEVPTTEAQREIWTNVQFGGHEANCAYNESVSIDLEGDFNYSILVDAVQILFQRHDSLRSAFSDDGMIMQIHNQMNLEIPFIDFSGLSNDELKKKLDEILSEEAEHDFDLLNGPLGKISLVKISGHSYRLILTFHHIVCDGWSLGIIMQDLSKIYSALVKGESYQDLPAASYSEYAIAEQHYLGSDEHVKTENYWLQQFKGSIPALELPINRQRPALRTYKANRIDVEVDAQLVEKIKILGARQGISFVATLVSAFEVYMYRITRSEDVVVGLATAGQATATNQNLVGHCVNLLPLRSKVSPNLSFIDYLKMRKPAILDAYDHQRYTFGSLVTKLNLPRDPSRIPLVPVSFNVDVGITNGVEFEACTFRFSTNPRHYENFELFINAAGNGNELTLECTYNTDLFETQMMHLRMLEFVELLKSISLNPENELGLLNLLTPDEKELLFIKNKGTEMEVPPLCIHQLFENAAKTFPGNTALVFDNLSITYADLDDAANRFANYLATKGVGPEITVAVYMERSIDLIIAILAILKSGAAYVPVDPSYPADRVSYIVNDSDAVLVITWKNQIENILIQNAEFLFMEDFQTEEKSWTGTKPDTAVTSQHPCYLIYTSGSTGKPKGVVLNHFSVVNYITWCNSYYFGNQEFGNFGLYSSLSFDLTVTSIFCSLTRGKSLTIYRQNEDINDIINDMFFSQNDVDVIKMTPSHILLLERINNRNSKIKKAIVGGEALSNRHVEILRSINPAIEIINEYGPTEATVGCVIKNVIEPDDAKLIGKPIANTEIFILDKNAQELPPGIPGSLFIAGYGLARGYYNQNLLTDSKFRILTINGESSRMYDSGDLAKFHLNGDIEFLGRIDNQVKIRGYRIELGEIESELLAISDVREQLVMAREDEPGEKIIVAYIVKSEGSVATADSLKQSLRLNLPEYMIPSSFIFLDEFPLNANGKIDHSALPVPGKQNRSENISYAEPKSSVEELLANIWGDILGLDKVGRNDNFFELGGHSILGVKVMNELEKQTGTKLRLPVLFSSPTIAELARVIRKEGTSKPWSCIVPLREKGNRTPLFCIHMHNGNIHRWRVLLKHLPSDQPVYAIQPRGLDEKQKPHTSIEEMASYYVQLIKQIQPEGPYNLLGLCFSGMVVFEMAAILQASGNQVSFLGMVNNYAPPENPTMYKIKTEWNKFQNLELTGKLKYAIEKRKFVNRLFTSVKSNVDEMQEREEIQADEYQDPNDLRTIHSLALLKYHPKHYYNGSLVLIRSGGAIEKYYNDKLGWDRLVKGPVSTFVIEGSDTDTIITDEPYNTKLAEIVGEQLQMLYK